MNFDYWKMINEIPWWIRDIIFLCLVFLAFVAMPPANQWPEPTTRIESNASISTNKPLSDELGWQLIIIPLLAL